MTAQRSNVCELPCRPVPLKLPVRCKSISSIALKIDLEFWPAVSFEYGEDVTFKISPAVYVSGKIIGIGDGHDGQTTYYVRVSSERVVAKTKKELS